MDQMAIARHELRRPCVGAPDGAEPGVHETRTASRSAVSALRRTARAWTRLCCLDEDVAEDVVLAVDEAVSNVVEHAYPQGPGPVSLELTRHGDGGLLAVVRDRGRWRPPPDPGYRGRGLLLIDRLADTAGVVDTEAGTTVWMRWTASTAVRDPRQG